MYFMQGLEGQYNIRGNLWNYTPVTGSTFRVPVSHITDIKRETLATVHENSLALNTDNSIWWWN